MRTIINGIPVEVIKKNIKNLHLYVLPPDGGVRVTAPKTLSDDSIRDFVGAKTEWIRKKREMLASRPRPTRHRYVSGEEIYLFGVRYPLEVVYAGRSRTPVISGGRVTLTVREDSTPERREAYIDEWYRAMLRAEIEKHLPKWEKITGLHPLGWRIKKMKTRWGTCNTVTGKIWLNLRLAAYPVECLEYVILHELAHLKERNHGKKFEAVLDGYMPRWREIKKALNVSGQVGV